MKSVLIIGIGKLGNELVHEFFSLGIEVMAVDKIEERVNDVLPFVTNAQIGDASNQAFMNSLGIDSFDVCLVAIGNDFQSSLEITSLVKEMGGKLVVSLSDSDRQSKFLLRNGADEVINPDKQVARWAAIKYSSEQIYNFITLDENHAIYEVAVPSEWDGKNVKQVDIRKKYALNILATKKGEDFDFVVTPDTAFEDGMSMLVMGEYRNLRKCFRL